MQPWTDDTGPGARPRAARPCWPACSTTCLPARPNAPSSSGRTPRTVVAAVAERCRQVTVLLRSRQRRRGAGRERPGQRQRRRRLRSTACRDVPGRLRRSRRGRRAGPGPRAPTATTLSWPERLGLLARLGAGGAHWCCRLENELASLTTLLDARVRPSERHGDDEWRPIHSDDERPIGLPRLRRRPPPRPSVPRSAGRGGSWVGRADRSSSRRAAADQLSPEDRASSTPSAGRPEPWVLRSSRPPIPPSSRRRVPAC